MKRGKDDEKVMGPMFPRLHVNDTEKGGPRAPPRNKMALYEQLSIPSQRFKPGSVPSNPSSPATPASSSQGNGHQRNTYYPRSLPPPVQSSEKQSSLYYDSSASLLSHEQKKHSEEDDFRVPILTQFLVGQDRGRSFLSGPAITEPPKKQLTNVGNGPRQIIAVRSVPRQEGRKQNDENKDGVCELSIEGTDSIPASKGEVASRQGGASVSHIHEDYVPSNGSRLPKAGPPLQPERRGNSSINSPVLVDGVYNESTRFESNGDSVPRFDMDPEDQRIQDDSEVCENKTYRSLPAVAADRDGDASETSVVDSVSGLDICPDDVVGIIGQKHFWKARRAIVNQQRVFAVQVFELHRLIKVQRLFAGSPNLLVEDSTYLGKPIKGSAPKKLSIEYAVKGVPNVSKHHNDSEKQNYKIEGSAENTVGKNSLSSVQNNNQPPSYNQLVANSPAPAAAGDHTKGPWCFHQPQGHQWLIPVMSPSEGLVYKPYPGPGMMAPACGGCGPPGSTPPTMGNFFPPPYGVPAMHHYQGMGAPPFPSPAGPPGYFPPFGMAVMSQGIAGPPVDPMTHYAASGMHGQPPWLGINNGIQHQNSSNTQSLLNGVTMDASKSKGSLDVGMQISTASSPNMVVQENGRGNTSEGSGVLPLFPTAPIVESPTRNTPPPREVDHPAGVIKVVPRNGISATESVARIFRSIQEERKHYDSV
ncbi:OLC1v1029158C1 [Oldenlandia corymbosa var. corymbosa]|uniref:OLC1v1029158C1 n=1 Tax=Oldenlandia corymbosa var. corymbosa TaxID=529605 RepID=A0AAV1CDB7_OLDCO|nr:OLC1v1029158C1 [Oldenlandia corymbosa var. corymbosa]